MISNAKLYLNSKILPERNFVVEDLASYLNTLSKLTLGPLNYFRISNVKTSLKLELRQELCEAISTNDYNYLEIQNTSEAGVTTRKYYYFVINKKWKSENCIELELFRDTANTYLFGVDYVATSRTKVLREHRDRFRKLTLPTMISEHASFYCDDFDEDSQMFHGTAVLGPFKNLIGLEDYDLDYYSPEDDIDDIVVDTTDGTIIIASKFFYDEKYVNVDITIEFTLEKIVRNVDFTPEQINPILYRGEEDQIQQPINTSWNLIYKNRDDINPQDFEQINPVECYVAPDVPLLIKGSTGGKSIDFSALTYNTYYYIGAPNNGHVTIKLTDNAGHDYNINERHYGAHGYQTDESRYIVLFRPSGQSYFQVKYYYYHKIQGESGVTTLVASYTSITSLTCISEQESINYATNASEVFGPFETIVNGTFNFSVSNLYLNSLQSMDRTDSKIIKIIKLPYSPAAYSIGDDQRIIFEGPWNYDVSTSFFKLSDLNSKFNYTFRTNLPDPAEKLIVDLTPTAGVLRNIENESKLLHSEFYYNKFVYDSFGFEFNLEAVDPEKIVERESTEFEVGFVATTTINSRFLFYFPGYKLKSYCKSSDYDNVLPVARNNEVVLYNNQYINYLRTGYNYDVKAKQRTDAATGINSALAIIGAISSVGLGVASGNPLLAIGGVVAGFSTTGHAIMNMLNATAQSEQNLNSKMDQLRAQATSVAGSDDIDILEAYSDNRAKLTEYRVSDKMRKALADLFHYCGYNTNEMKVPATNTRLYFNYVQAELDISESANLSSEDLSDLVERFKAGITFLHKVNAAWDWTQTKENWEVNILG